MNIYEVHPLMVNSGQFWRCPHGRTGVGQDGLHLGCLECAESKIVLLRAESVVARREYEESVASIATLIDDLWYLDRMKNGHPNHGYRDEDGVWHERRCPVDDAQTRLPAEVAKALNRLAVAKEKEKA